MKQELIYMTKECIQADSDSLDCSKLESERMIFEPLSLWHQMLLV